MSCFININGKEYTKEEFERNLSNPSFVKQVEAQYSNSQEEYQDAKIKLGQFQKYVQFKESLIGQLENRLVKIKVAKKNTSSQAELRKLIKLEHEIQFQLNGNDAVKGLNQQVETLKKNKDINAVGYYAERDLERLNSLSKSTDPDDLKEARKIVNFYTAAGTFDAAKEHPIFTHDEIFNEDGSYALSDLVRLKFEDWKNRANEKNNEIVTNEKAFIEETVNSNPQIKKMYEKLSYEDLNKPIEDASWLDMMIMDISNGIFSQNGIMPQIMLDTIQKKFESQLADVKQFEEELNKLLPKVEKELEKDYSLRALGILGVRGVSYDLFKQLNEDGKATGSLAIRYSQQFYDTLSQFNTSFYTTLNSAKAKDDAEKVIAAYNSRNNWYRKNTLMMDINQIPEITSGAEVDNAHVRELKSILGEQGYKEEVEKQKENVNKWDVDFKVWKELFLEERGITEDQLTEEQQDEIDIYEKSNSPYYGIKTYYESIPIIHGTGIVNNGFKYNIAVPRRVKAIVNLSPDGISFRNSKDETGFYDKNFEKIEANPTLKQFHTLMLKQLDTIRSKMPAEAQKKMRINSLPGVRKSIAEILMDKNVGILKGLWIATKEIYDRIKSGFGINIQSSISNASIDVATGKPDYQVNDSFLGNNKTDIQNLVRVEQSKFAQTLANKKKTINKHTTLEEKHLTPGAIQLLSNYLGVAPNARAIIERTGKYIPIGRIIEAYATDIVVQEQSFDLPKVMKYYSTMASEYIARNELLPLMEVMKNHYTEIKKTSTNNIKSVITLGRTQETAVEGLRTNAIKQMDDWFNRVVLGNFGTKAFGVIQKAVKYDGTPESKKKLSTRMFNSFTSGKLLSSREKEFRAEIDKALETETNEETIRELNQIRNSLGKNFALSAMFDSMLGYVRFLGLGYNLSSSITNFMEGQSANFIIASSGDFFEPNHYYRALHIAKGSFIKNLSFGKVQTEGAKKNRALMDKYRIIQDSTNELQKASTKSAISGVERYSPYALTQRVEFLNQSPLMIAIALNTELTGKNGEKQNLWDAMNADGTLKEQFKTPENIANWENGNGEAYNEFKSKVSKAIDTAHGNYESLRGMMAKSSVLGKAVLMFKSWIGRAAYSRLAKPQDDVQLGVKGYKGRYFSHTPVSGAMQGALIGLAAAGTVGTGLGAVAGLALGSFYGAKSSLGMLQEMTFNVKALIRKALGNPINIISGKEVIDVHPNMDDFIGEKFTKRDAVNLQANLSDMSLLLSWVALTLIVKAAMWDDEDEEDDPRRLTHNFLVNKLMQLTSQSNMFLDPSELYSNTLGDLSVLGFLDNVSKTVAETNDYLQGYDIIPTGVNAGESALFNQVQKTFLPSIARDFPSFGFEKQTEKQFEVSPLDSWFWSDEKNQEKIIKGRRAARKRELKKEFEDSELDEDVIEKRVNRMVNREIPLP